MRYMALACDYDGTIAHDGQVSQSTIESLERLAALRAQSYSGYRPPALRSFTDISAH
jgi:hypothetical protein